MMDLAGSVKWLRSPGGDSVWVLADHGKRLGLVWTIVEASGSHARVRNEDSPTEQGVFFAAAQCIDTSSVPGTMASEMGL